MSRDSHGAHRQVRSSALWGTGNQGGDSRANALWGKGTRGFLTAAAAVFLLAAPAASADRLLSGKEVRGFSSYVDPQLLEQASETPDKLVRVIIRSKGGLRGARNAFDEADRSDSTIDGEHIRRAHSFVGAAAVTIEARKLRGLARIPGLTITADAPMQASAVPTSGLLWPGASRLLPLWSTATTSAPKAPTIAIVDSGIEGNLPDFDGGARVIDKRVLTNLQPNSTGDGRGHGTFVAAIAAGSAPGYAGASPTSNIVSLDVMDDNGMALTSDVIAAAEWIYNNRQAKNIRVANFSLHSTRPSNFTEDPLDKAVEKLWFGGVVVVAASGNYGVATGPSGVKYAPGNDPFVITVGAIDLENSSYASQHDVPSWSAYGYTYDGFRKPEIGAAGRYMIGAVPTYATLRTARPLNVVSPTHMRLSGTSFAAPVVAGVAAQILARHPSWTPDQVKGALMLTARSSIYTAGIAPPSGSVGVGEVYAEKAAAVTNPPNPNLGLNQFLVPDPNAGGAPVFNAASWESTAKANVSWDSVSWSDVSWSDASWESVSWSDVSWTDVSWTDVSWSDNTALADVSWEDAAGLDVAPRGGDYLLGTSGAVSGQ